MTARDRIAALQSGASLPELAYEALREAIISRRFDFGEPLRQEDLADAFGVSRLPVREALRRLEAEGLVVMRPRRGYFVASFSSEEIEEVFDMRALLEARAAYLATARRGAADVEELEERLRIMEVEAARDPLDPAAFAAANSEFHERLFTTSGRVLHCRMLRVLRTSGDRYTRMSVGLAREIAESGREHRAIFAAFRDGDAAAAAERSREHCENTCRRLLANLSVPRAGGARGKPVKGER
jgi:DNA-binding GntR family transcriptional regulator